jgi:hypothetical protein
MIEKLLARLDGAPALPAPLAEKARKVDRIAGSVARVQVEKIDPSVAARLIAR